MDADRVFDGALAEIPADATLLIAGPSMTGKYELLFHLLQYHADSAIIVTTKHGYERVRNDVGQMGGGFDESQLGIVDCVSYHQSVDVDDVSGPVVFADSPENLTRIGVRLTGLIEDFQDRTDSGAVGLGVHSLSQLLMHSDLRKVYQFLQVLTGQVRSLGWFAAAVIDVSAEDDQEFQKLYHHFDGVVETRENDDGIRELKVRGFGPQTTGWSSF